MFLTLRSPSDSVPANEFLLYLFVNPARDVNLAGISNALKTRSNIDTIAVNIICFDDDVAKIDANSILDPMVLWQRCITTNQVLLDDDAATHGFYRTVENRDKAVPSSFNEFPVVFYDGGFDEIALDPLDAIVRPLFVDLH